MTNTEVLILLAVAIGLVAASREVAGQGGRALNALGFVGALVAVIVLFVR
jgi:hypothetical protein